MVMLIMLQSNSTMMRLKKSKQLSQKHRTAKTRDSTNGRLREQTQNSLRKTTSILSSNLCGGSKTRIRLVKLMFGSRHRKKLKKSSKDAMSILNIFQCRTLAGKRRNSKIRKMELWKHGPPVVRFGSFRLVFQAARQRTCMTLSQPKRKGEWEMLLSKSH